MADLEKVSVTLTGDPAPRVRLLLSKRVMDEWSDVVPDLWKTGAEPLVILGSELVVRAASSHGVRLLRYAIGSLLEALHDRYGTEDITEVRVVAPSGR